MVNKAHATVDEVACYRRWFRVVRPRVFSKMVFEISSYVYFEVLQHNSFQTKEQRKRLDAEMLSVALFPTDPFGVVRQLQ